MHICASRLLTVHIKQPKKVSRWEQLTICGKDLRLLNIFFQCKGDIWFSIFVPSLLLLLGPISWSYTLFSLFPPPFFFLLLITHFSQENYAHVLFIIPRAAIISQILFLIHEQNGIKTRLNGMCLPSKLNNLEKKITGGYLKVVTTKNSLA